MRRLVLLVAATGVIGLVMAVAQSVSVFFGPRVDFPVGSSPVGIVTTDFNSDGKADIAVANSESDNVSVLLGNGIGGFSATGPFDVAAGPEALAAGDLNHDTRPDLVVAGALDDAVTVLLGNGNGTFEAEPDIPVGVSPLGIALGDFNNDDDVDIVNTNYFDEPGTVTLLLGNGDGTFQSPALTVEVDVGPLGIAVGRLNNDNNDDLVVGIYDFGVVYVLLGNGNGTFQSPSIYEVGLMPTGIVIGQLNQDQIADIAVANEDSDSVAVLLGTGDGAFATAVEYESGSLPQAVVAADFNDDQILDLVTADYLGTETLDNSVSVLIGAGDGTFAAAQSFETNISPFGVVATDFDGDNLPDIATANLDTSDVSLLVNHTDDPPTPTPTGATPTPTPPAGQCVGDCDADTFVRVNEVVIGVNIALDRAELGECSVLDVNQSGSVEVNELIRAVNNLLGGCSE